MFTCCGTADLGRQKGTHSCPGISSERVIIIYFLWLLAPIVNIPVSHVSHPDFLPSVHLSATPLTCQAFYPTHSGQFQYFMIHFIRQIVF